jgi:hypothetical protein
VALTGGLLLTGCIPATPAPHYVYAAPVVTSVSASPGPVVAGQTVTFQLTATHEAGITTVDLAPYDPVGVRLPDSFGCGGSAAEVVSGTPTERTVALTCTFPSIAPDGQWTLRYAVQATDSPTTTGAIPFLVTGGSGDTSPPAVVEASPGIGGNDYTPIDPHQPLVVRLRVTDPHGPITFDPPISHPAAPGPDGYRSRTCTDVTTTISPEVVELQRTCVHGDDGRIIAGEQLVQVIAYDGLGHGNVVHFQFQYSDGTFS